MGASEFPKPHDRFSYSGQFGKEAKTGLKHRETSDYFLSKLPKAHLLLSGNPGCGKTHLAVSIGVDLIHERNWDVFYVETAPLGYAHFVDKGDLLKKATDRMYECNLLILDDVNPNYRKEKFRKDREIDLVEAVVTQRYTAMKPTILITNQRSLPFSPPTLSRLQRFNQLDMGGPDYRSVARG